jgi:hypothetical protein
LVAVFIVCPDIIWETPEVLGNSIRY